MLGSDWFPPGLSPLALSSVSSPVACRRHRRSLLLHVFRRLDDASSPPLFPKVLSPQIVWLVVVVSLLSRPRLSALKEKEQANRAHHTLHVSVPVMLFGSFVFVIKNTATVFLVMWYLAAFGSNSQRFSGELLVPLFRCCCCC